MRVPAVVGAWPRPLRGGYDGARRPVAVECLGGGPACAEVRRRIERAGVTPAAAAGEDAIRVLVGPWNRVDRDPAAGQIAGGPDTSGVFADLGAGPECRLRALDEDGRVAADLGDGGLVAATRRYDGPPVWVVTGCTAAAAATAAGLLDSETLRDRYAVATAPGGAPLALPRPAESGAG
jgi:hypothetical protein